MFCVLYVMFWLCVVCTIECSQLLVPSLPFKCQSVPPQPNLDLTSSSSLLSSTLQKSGSNVYVVFQTDQNIKDWRRRFCVKSKRGWISVEAISWGLLTAHNLTNLDRATSNFFEILRHTHTISIPLQREVFKTAKVREDVWRCWFGQQALPGWVKRHQSLHFSPESIWEISSLELCGTGWLGVKGMSRCGFVDAYRDTAWIVPPTLWCASSYHWAALVWTVRYGGGVGGTSLI